MKNTVAFLRSRGLVHDVSHESELDQALSAGSMPFYCGFDPTADSLHVGSMLPLLVMARLQKAGHKPIALLGSATGMIGDPSGRSEERKLLTQDEVEHNLACIEEQVRLFLPDSNGASATVVRNGEWLSKLSLIDFLRDTGKHFSVNSMIAKESVRERLENREQGISYTEFSYLLLQAYDFLYLHEKYGCKLQIGGSDQWGNITAGIDLIRRKSIKKDPSVFGLTIPLLTTSSGAKFGKTADGAVWLSKEKTSAYQFYQYWVNTLDADVVRYLRLFTELGEEELQSLSEATASMPGARTGQKRLAELLTTLVHGDSATAAAVRASELLFGAAIENVDAKTLLDVFKDVPSTSVAKAKLSSGVTVQELLMLAQVAESKSAAKRIIESGGIYINNVRAASPEESVGVSRFIDGQVLVIRSGKRSYFLVQLS